MQGSCKDGGTWELCIEAEEERNQGGQRGHQEGFLEEGVATKVRRSGVKGLGSQLERDG